jgi:hypothetical protein
LFVLNIIDLVQESKFIKKLVDLFLAAVLKMRGRDVVVVR